jgi:aspartate/methionine/tyrosine aminotransferase
MSAVLCTRHVHNSHLLVARRYSPLLGRSLDWQTEIAVGVGSSETLFACMQALVNPGDEVLMLSPAFDIYSCVGRARLVL